MNRGLENCQFYSVPFLLLIQLFKARKEDAERKRQEALEKKQERERMLAEEIANEKGSSKKTANAPTKLTR